ncbi:MAG: hypothetical protein IT436_17670 [Phycisphaerales bacterium]|nr:hypothetical protein [Phycisphaerales bacterium]
MRHPMMALPVVIGLLSGCVVTPGETHYTLDIHNISEQPITMDLIRIERGLVGHTRADLMPGGSYINEFSTDSGFDFVEARFRLAGRHADDPFYPFELPRYGSAKRDVAVRDERIVMMERKINSAK